MKRLKNWVELTRHPQREENLTGQERLDDGETGDHLSGKRPSETDTFTFLGSLRQVASGRKDLKGRGSQVFAGQL
jgi:hypothetical protein